MNFKTPNTTKATRKTKIVQGQMTLNFRQNQLLGKRRNEE